MAEKDGGVAWGAVALGWLVAMCAGVVVSPVLRLLYGLAVEPPLERSEFTTAIVVVSLLSGFLSHLLGGCVAGRLAGGSGGLNGAMTAVFGLILGIILAAALAVFGVVFVEAVALPPATFGLAGAALLADAILFLVNLFGGFVGGKMGEPSIGWSSERRGRKAKYDSSA